MSYGWLSIALVIFSLWNPGIAILGSVVFGTLDSLSTKLGLSSAAQNALLGLIPYVVTVIVLLAVSITGSKKIQPPASLGINYFREER